jgi:arsenate reductase
LTEGKLRELLRKMGLAPFEVLRKGEAKFKELGITAETPPGDIIKYIVENPSLLQRPIVEVGDKAVMARPIDKALALIAN